MKKPRANTRHILAMLTMASQADIEQGKEWYDRAHRLGVRLMNAYGLSLGQCVGVISALSPNNKWERNCADAESMIKAYAHGADPMSVKVCTFNANKKKAAQIIELDMESADPEAIPQILSGRKVVAFYKSIMGHNDAVCVDGHAYAIWLGERVPITQTPSIGVNLYAAIARSYVLASHRATEICGERLTPAQVQAVTWVTYRRLLGYN